MSKLVYGYDLETFPNIFTAVFIDKEQENTPLIFEISERKNELGDMLDFLRNEVKGLIGYNNLNFDSQIIEWFFRNQHLTIDEYNVILPDLMLEVDTIINRQYPEIPEWKLNVPNLDDRRARPLICLNGRLVLPSD